MIKELFFFFFGGALAVRTLLTLKHFGRMIKRTLGTAPLSKVKKVKRLQWQAQNSLLVSTFSSPSQLVLSHRFTLTGNDSTNSLRNELSTAYKSVDWNT